VREQAGEAQGKWDKLEQVFEDRVSRSLSRLGVLTSARSATCRARCGAQRAGARDDGGKRPRPPRSGRARQAPQGAAKKPAAKKR
jgi:hypothetical protein